MSNFLHEAFQALKLTESETFELDKAGVADLSDFLSTDFQLEDTTVDIIDPEAETEEDLQKTYIGEVILECQACHVPHYCHPDDVVIDEEAGLANIEDTCPNCYSNEGFKIVGTVAPYEDITVEASDDVEVEVDGKEISTTETEKEEAEVDADLDEAKATVDKEALKKRFAGRFATNESLSLREKRLASAKKHLTRKNKEEDIEACQKNPVDTEKSIAGELKEAKKRHLTRKEKEETLQKCQKGKVDVTKSPAGELKEWHSEFTKSQSKRWRLVEADDEEATTNAQSEKTTDTADINTADTDDAFTALVDKLQAIDDYASFVAALKNLNADQKKLFMDNFGKIDHDKVKPQVSDTSIAATKLIPTQSEIDWKKSLDGIFEFGCAGAFASPAVAGSPVLVYNGEYIIDGHHRWSQLYTCNPNAKCSVTNYTYSSKDPDDVLRDFQGAVLASTGAVGVGKAGVNVWGASADEMKKYVIDNIPDNVVAELGKYTNGAVKDKETAANYLVGNLAKLAKNNKPYGGSAAPKRTDMPQTKDATKNLVKSQGLTKMSEARGANKTHLSRKEKEETLQKCQKGRVDTTKSEAGELKEEKASCESGKCVDKKQLKRRHITKNSDDEALEICQKNPVDTTKSEAGKLREAKKRHLTRNEDEEKLLKCQKGKVDTTKSIAGELKESDAPAATSIEDAQKWVDYDMKKYGHISDKTNELVKKAGFQIVKDQYGDYEVIAGKYDESLTEAMEDISITTGDEVIKIKATPRADKETVVPPTELATEEETEEVEEGAVEEMPDLEDVEIEEVDESSFDSLGESYLKRAYNNVKSFKTQKAMQSKNALVLEGKIEFKSGKVVTTRFIFEAANKDKKGNLQFLGLNENLAKKKGAFKLSASITDKKLVCESLNYNYHGKDLKSGKSQRLYGTVKNR